MATVYVKQGESIDAALKRFKKKVEKDGIMSELRKRTFYRSPSEKRKIKHLKALKARRKRAKKQKV